MNQQNITDIAEALQRRAEEKLGHERAEALRPDLQQMAKELHSLDSHNVEYEDEP
jgi:Fic family protein